MDIFPLFLARSGCDVVIPERLRLLPVVAAKSIEVYDLTYRALEASGLSRKMLLARKERRQEMTMYDCFYHVPMSLSPHLLVDFQRTAVQTICRLDWPRAYCVLSL
jgi:hypothetical protein